MPRQGWATFLRAATGHTKADGLLWVRRGRLRTTVRGRRWLRRLLVARKICSRRRAQCEFDPASRVVVHSALQIELIYVYGIFSAIGRDVMQLASREPV